MTWGRSGDPGLVPSQAGSALVAWTPIPPVLECLGCDVTSDRAEWGHYKVMLHEGKKTMVPHKMGCFKCVTAVKYSGKPKDADWEEFEPLLMSNPECKNELALWRGRLDAGGVYDAAFTPEGVDVKTEVSLSWVEDMDINIMDPSVSTPAVQKMTDPRGAEHNVVLTVPDGDTSARRKAVWQSKTTYTFTEHHLRPETMVREQQGKEVWAACRGSCPFRGPMTRTEYEKMTKGGSATAAPPRDAGLDQVS